MLTPEQIDNIRERIAPYLERDNDKAALREVCAQAKGFVVTIETVFDQINSGNFRIKTPSGTFNLSIEPINKEKYSHAGNK